MIEILFLPLPEKVLVYYPFILIGFHHNFILAASSISKGFLWIPGWITEMACLVLACDFDKIDPWFWCEDSDITLTLTLNVYILSGKRFC